MRLSLKEIKIQAMWITVVFVLTICIQIPSTSTLSDKDDFDYNGFNDYGNCHDHCAACNDSTCTLCKEGWHGVAEEVSGEVAFICDQPCPTPCKSGHCDGKTGYCKDGCKHGYYGKRCEGNCKQICVYGECDSFGNCTIGCEAGTFGPRCDATCPQRCKDALCDVLNGSCSKGCAGNLYGSHCNMTCPNNCNTIAVGPSCQAESGMCLAGCLNGFYGQRCSDMCQHCVNNTCQKDNGVCVHGCILGYRLDVAARKCVYDINECATIPCKNGARCIDGINAYSCKCVAGWTGTNCDQNINECATIPCKNGATCIDRMNAYSCKCVAGWTGTNCSQNINECATIPCKNGATCIDGMNAYSCKCVAGWTGTNCDQNKDVNGYNDNGNCHDHCAACNGSTCKLCKEGWYGEAEEVSGEVAFICDQPCPTPCSHDNDGDPMTQTPESISKPLTVVAIAVGAIAVGCVVIVVVVIRVIVHRKRRRTESRSIETPMKEMDNAIYETCEEPSDRITTVNCNEEVDIGRVDNRVYKYDGNSDFQDPVPKAKTYKRSTDWRGQGKHNASQLETLAADQPGFISPNAEVFRGDDGYEVHFPSTSGRNAVDENDANIYSEPDERCFGPKDYIE
ncbi:fibropellin-1-like isoform X8 [Dreissena polymorpha]|uniref:fibropellin-1-like isoform X8 n=1 Tax=Dreissena polymorpha TaxID=45954 RepID=UPI002263CC08|nr:fibropellin-1-like isoform X8 [Dreissena polymorpha]